VKSGKKDVMIDTRMTRNTGSGKNKRVENGTKLIQNSPRSGERIIWISLGNTSENINVNTRERTRGNIKRNGDGRIQNI
jgi:hypothetical protein